MPIARRITAVLALSLVACASSDPAPQPTSCQNAPTTWDCGTRQIAETICGARTSCHVCVQRVDASGRAATWAAVESPASCGCGAPFVDAATP